MSQTDASERAESSAETTRTAARSGRRYVSKVAPYLRRGAESGAVTAIVGGTGLLGGIRALLRGERRRGLVGLVLGGTFLAVAVNQRRSRKDGRESDVEVTDVAGTGPDVGAIADEAGGVGEEDRAGGEAASAVVDTSPDVQDAGSGREPEGSGRASESPSGSGAESASVDQRDVVDTGVDSRDLAQATENAEATESETGDADVDIAIGREDVDRLGEAAFDGQSREVPVPQRAFNQGFLGHSTEAFWGVRGRDDAVLVSQDYDAVQGPGGVQFVASSEIGDDARELPIPTAVLDHWDEVLGGGTAVAGGDGILFVTTDDLSTDGLLWVLPAAWAEDVFGETE